MLLVWQKAALLLCTTEGMQGIRPSFTAHMSPLSTQPASVRPVCMQGLVLTCPAAAITLAQAPAEGRLEGLTCFMAGSAEDVVLGATPQKAVQDLVVVPQSLTAGTVFGILVAVLAGLAALGGVAYLLWKRKVTFCLLLLGSCGAGCIQPW